MLAETGAIRDSHPPRVAVQNGGVAMAHAPIALPFNRAPPRVRAPKPLTPPPAFDKPPVASFVLLSLLLHVLAILVFGAPSGGSREGRAMWGALRVTLQEAPREVMPVLKVERELAAVPQARVQARVAAPTKPQPMDLGVAKQLERLAVPKPEEAPVVVPRLIDRIVKPEPMPDTPPPLLVPPPTEAQVVAPKPIERVVAPEPVAPPAEAAVMEAPTPPPPPRVERPVAPPPVPAPLLQPAPPPPIAPPAERPPVEVQSIPIPRVESMAPPRVEPETRPVERAPPEEMSVAPKTPPSAERVQPPSAPAPTPPKAIERALPKDETSLRPSPFRPAAPGADTPFPRGSDQPSSNYDPTASSVDLDAARRRAGQLAREGTGNRALLPFAMPPLPKPKSKLETAIENARKPDCKTAYQSLGLAAIVPLIANEFGEGNCRW